MRIGVLAACSAMLFACGSPPPPDPPKPTFPDACATASQKPEVDADAIAFAILDTQSSTASRVAATRSMGCLLRAKRVHRAVEACSDARAAEALALRAPVVVAFVDAKRTKDPDHTREKWPSIDPCAAVLNEAATSDRPAVRASAAQAVSVADAASDAFLRSRIGEDLRLDLDEHERKSAFIGAALGRATHDLRDRMRSQDAEAASRTGASRRWTRSPPSSGTASRSLRSSRIRRRATC